MLRQETAENEQSASPATVYVTAAELSQAMTAIEARREAEAARQVNKISVEEAVRDLSLDVTPEELLAQIQAQRTAAENAAQRRQQALSDARQFGAELIALLRAAMRWLSDRLKTQTQATTTERSASQITPATSAAGRRSLRGIHFILVDPQHPSDQQRLSSLEDIFRVVRTQLSAPPETPVETTAPRPAEPQKSEDTGKKWWQQ